MLHEPDVHEQGERSPTRLLSHRDLADLPEPRYLLTDFITERGTNVLYGPSGGGKSFLALDMNLCISQGIEWYGQTVNKGPCVFIAGEGVSGQLGRIDAWCEERGVVDVSDFWIFPEAVNFYTGETAVFEAALKSLDRPPALITIDTMARCVVGGDENSARDVGLFIDNADKLAKRLGSALLIIHHTGKNGDIERGSSALRAAADTMLSLKPDGSALRISCEKQKEAAEFEPWTIHLEQVGDSCVIRLGGDVGRLSDHEQQILETVSASFGTDWTSATKVNDVAGVPKSSLYRSLNTLVERGQMEEQQVGKQRKEYRIKPDQGTVSNRPKPSNGTAETVPSHPTPLGVGRGTDETETGGAK